MMTDDTTELPPIYRIPDDLVVGDVYSLSAAPSNWGIAMLDVDAIRLESDGTGEIIGVVDTGIDSSHELFTGKIIAAKDFTGNNPADRQGHGTHTAGTAAGRNPDIGVASGAKLVIGKGLSDSGSGGGTGIAAAMRYCFDNGARIISMSLGSTGLDPSIDEAGKELTQQGAWIFCAAGNSGPNTPDVDFPGRLPWAISVAAVDNSLSVANFSSSGKKIDTAGPGVNILSAKPGGGYQTMSGTCIAEGEYVYTDQGPRPIESVVPGDVVYAYRDKRLVRRVVSNVHNRGTNRVHRLIARGRDVRATETHQMLAYNSKEKEMGWVKLADLNEHHKLVIPRNMDSQINPYLDSVIQSDFAWLLGFFLGDGWLSHMNMGCRVNFANKPGKLATMQRVQSIYEKYAGKSLKHSANGNWHYDDSTRQAMLFEFGGLNHPSTEKTVPIWIWNLSSDKQVAFYEGYRAADGHMSKSGADAFECRPKDLVRRLACLADYHGWNHGFIRSRSRILQAPNSDSPRPTVSHQLSIRRTPLVEGMQTATSKKNWKSWFESVGISASDFTLADWHIDQQNSEKTNVYDLTVPDADCFVTQGLVTHNSMSTPYVAGLMACYRGALVKKGLPLPTTAELRKMLIERSIDIGQPGVDRRAGPGVASPTLLRLTLTPLPPPVA